MADSGDYRRGMAKMEKDHLQGRFSIARPIAVINPMYITLQLAHIPSLSPAFTLVE